MLFRSVAGGRVVTIRSVHPAERHETIDVTVSKAIRALRQDAMARDLGTELTDEEIAWLDADAG